MPPPPWFTGDEVKRWEWLQTLRREIRTRFNPSTTRADVASIAHAAIEATNLSFGMTWIRDYWEVQEDARKAWITYAKGMTGAGLQQYIDHEQKEAPKQPDEILDEPDDPTPDEPTPDEPIPDDEPGPLRPEDPGPPDAARHTSRKPLMFGEDDSDQKTFFENLESIMERWSRPPITQFGEIGDQLKEQEESTKTELAKYLASAGQDTLMEQESEQSDRLKMRNLLMGQTPLHPLGQMDNPFWRSNLANQGLRYRDKLYPMPPVFMGGTMTSGTQPFGSYPTYPDEDAVMEQLYPIKFPYM